MAEAVSLIVLSIPTILVAGELSVTICSAACAWLVVVVPPVLLNWTYRPSSALVMAGRVIVPIVPVTPLPDDI